jgi:hypothetical protein
LGEVTFKTLNKQSTVSNVEAASSSEIPPGRIASFHSALPISYGVKVSA